MKYSVKFSIVVSYGLYFSELATMALTVHGDIPSKTKIG